MIDLSGYKYEGPLLQTAKSLLETGTYEGKKVVVKSLTDDDDYWSARLQGEINMYLIFKGKRPAFSVPPMVAYDYAQPYLVLEYIDGEPLSNDRYPSGEFGVNELEEIVSVVNTINKYGEDFAPGTSSVNKGYQERLQKYQSLSIISDEDVDYVSSVLDGDDWTPQFNHGDVVLSNFIRTSSKLVLLDWEFAGFHLPCYDLALLTVINWQNRQSVEFLQSCVKRRTKEQQIGYLANCIVVGAREIRIHGEMPVDDPARSRLQMLDECLIYHRKQYQEL